MKKFLVALMAIVAVACNSEEKKTGDDADKKEGMADAPMVNMYGYTPTYSSSFEMGDPKNCEVVLSLWKDWDAGDLSASKDKFSDSLTIYDADGGMEAGPKDSMIAGSQKYRDMYSQVKSEINAIMAVKSKDKNEDWVLVWGKEIHTDKKGKTDSLYLQETWRLKNGKPDLLYQFKRPGSMK